jgi:hypothetical protein
MTLRYQPLRALVVAAACLLVACELGQGADPPDPTATPTPEPIEWTRFTSDRYGYAMDHPSDWQALEKVGVSAVTALKPYGGGTDIFATADNLKWQTRHGMQVASFEVEDGTTLEDFTRSVHMPCGGAAASEQWVLDGEPAIWRRFSCNLDRPTYVQVTALHAGRGYVLWLMSSEPPRAHERPEYDVILESFEFTDGRAASN